MNKLFSPIVWGMTILPAGPGKMRAFSIFTFSKLMRLSLRVIRRKVIIAGELAAHQDWILRTFKSPTLYSSREKLWKQICRDLNGKKFRIIELGVYQGYATKWFLDQNPKHSAGQRLQSIDAFDLFTGLPNSWRDLEEGHFSNSGGIPDIHDDRCEFHAGYVESEILKLDKEKLVNDSTLVLFDLDLYGPTLASFLHLKSTFKPGDILYFDEAFDLDENRVIREQLLPNFEVEIIGYTAFALAVKIIKVIEI
jgi:hypothetical protein